jgi:hypothetical protein
VFQQRVPNRIFGPNRQEAKGERRKLHDEELHVLYNLTKYCYVDQMKEEEEEEEEERETCSTHGRDD